MAYTTILTIRHYAPLGRLGALDGTPDRGREAILAAAALLTRLASGFEKGFVEIQPAGTAAARAYGTLTLNGAAGAVGATIGSTLVTAVASGGDVNTAKLIAAAINANATTKTKVYATADAKVVTVKALVPGVLGTSVTMVASGTNVTSSGTLTGAAGVDVAPIVHDRS